MKLILLNEKDKRIEYTYFPETVIALSRGNCYKIKSHNEQEIVFEMTEKYKKDRLSYDNN